MFPVWTIVKQSDDRVSFLKLLWNPHSVNSLSEVVDSALNFSLYRKTVTKLRNQDFPRNISNINLI